MTSGRLLRGWLYQVLSLLPGVWAFLQRMLGDFFHSDYIALVVTMAAVLPLLQLFVSTNGIIRFLSSSDSVIILALSPLAMALPGEGELVTALKWVCVLSAPLYLMGHGSNWLEKLLWPVPQTSNNRAVSWYPHLRWYPGVVLGVALALNATVMLTWLPQDKGVITIYTATCFLLLTFVIAAVANRYIVTDNLYGDLQGSRWDYPVLQLHSRLAGRRLLLRTVPSTAKRPEHRHERSVEETSFSLHKETQELMKEQRREAGVLRAKWAAFSALTLFLSTMWMWYPALARRFPRRFDEKYFSDIQQADLPLQMAATCCQANVIAVLSFLLATWYDGMNSRLHSARVQLETVRSLLGVTITDASTSSVMKRVWKTTSQEYLDCTDETSPLAWLALRRAVADFHERKCLRKLCDSLSVVVVPVLYVVVRVAIHFSFHLTKEEERLDVLEVIMVFPFLPLTMMPLWAMASTLLTISRCTSQDLVCLRRVQTLVQLQALMQKSSSAPPSVDDGLPHLATVAPQFVENLGLVIRDLEQEPSPTVHFAGFLPSEVASPGIFTQASAALATMYGWGWLGLAADEELFSPSSNSTTAG